jgi:hypothetical protein
LSKPRQFATGFTVRPGNQAQSRVVEAIKLSPDPLAVDSWIE